MFNLPENGSTNHVSSSGVTALKKAAVDIGMKRRACLKRCTSPKFSSHSHRPLNFYPRKLESESRKLLCLTIFL